MSEAQELIKEGPKHLGKLPCYNLSSKRNEFQEKKEQCSEFYKRAKIKSFVLQGPEGEIPLTPQEYRVLQSISRGFTVKAAAESLDISSRTAEYYLDNIKNKSGLTRKEELIKLFLNQGLQELSS